MVASRLASHEHSPREPRGDGDARDRAHEQAQSEIHSSPHTFEAGCFVAWRLLHGVLLMLADSRTVIDPFIRSTPEPPMFSQ